MNSPWRDVGGGVKNNRLDLRPGTASGLYQVAAAPGADAAGPGYRDGGAHQVVMTDLASLSADLFAPSEGIQRLTLEQQQADGYMDIYGDGAGSMPSSPDRRGAALASAQADGKCPPRAAVPRAPLDGPNPPAPAFSSAAAADPRRSLSAHAPGYTLGSLATMGLGSPGVGENPRRVSQALMMVGEVNMALAPSRKAYSAGTQGFGLDVRPPSRGRPPNESLHLFNQKEALFGSSDPLLRNELGAAKKKTRQTAAAGLQQRPQTSIGLATHRWVLALKQGGVKPRLLGATRFGAGFGWW